MRDYKFRGKRVNNGEWVYGDLVHHKQRIFIHGQLSPLMDSFIEVIPATVGMYTGLKNKAGTEIWEGDLLVSPADNRTYEVRWNQGAFWLFHKPYTRMDKLAASGANVNEIGTDISKFGYCSKLAVIGTIHDKAEGE